MTSKKDQSSKYLKSSVENAALTLFSSLLNRFDFDIQLSIQNQISSNLKKNFERSTFRGQKTSHFFNSTIISKKNVRRSTNSTFKDKSSTTTAEGKSPLFTTRCFQREFIDDHRRRQGPSLHHTIYSMIIHRRPQKKARALSSPHDITEPQSSILNLLF